MSKGQEDFKVETVDTWEKNERGNDDGSEQSPTLVGHKRSLMQQSSRQVSNHVMDPTFVPEMVKVNVHFGEGLQATAQK